MTIIPIPCFQLNYANQTQSHLHFDTKILLFASQNLAQQNATKHGLIMHYSKKI
ncbi:MULTISPECIES: hypothetical protein [Helicobacter]|uniref:hypothetical protein n=1 Tax=Helicobacter TaxID=209 RepID=UPI0003A3DC77|nr:MULTISPECIES: hypothetical protein [Helicobacter]MDY5949605.1 hypothetical protein [Helicobacter sp.]